MDSEQKHETIAYVEKKYQADETVSISSDFFASKCHQLSGRRAHFHSCIEMAYVIAGTVEHTINLPDGSSAVQTLNAGNYLIFDQTVSHSFGEPTKNFLLMNLLFRPSLISASLQDSSSVSQILADPWVDFAKEGEPCPLANTLLSDPDGRILYLFEKAWKVHQTMESGYRTLLRCYLTEILVLSAKKVLPGALPPQKSQIVGYICDYVHAHFTENISLSEICREQYLNPSFISRKFKNTVGMTFENYLQQTRIQNACMELVETDLSVEEIGEKVGYSDPGSFRKIFRRILGITPSEFRKQNH